MAKSRPRRSRSAAVADAAAIVPAEAPPLARGWDGLQNVVAGLGTNRDKRSFSAYAPVMPLQQQDLENMYSGSWLPGRIVDTVTEDMTREWVTLSWDGYDTDEGGVKAIADAERKFAVRSQVTDGVRWGRLHGGAGAVVRLKNDGLSLSEPLEMDKIKKDDLLGINVFDRWYLNPEGGQMVQDPGPNFGCPKFYSLTGLAGGAGVERIHASRIIRFGGAKTPRRRWEQNGWWDDSVLLKPQEVVKDYDATSGGIASMVWEASIDIIKAKGLKRLLATKDGEATVTKRYLSAAIMKSFNRMLLLDGDDEEWQQKTIAFSGLDRILMGMMNNVSGAADIPLTRLFGQSPSGMTATGESDIRNYYDHVAARQDSDLRPQLEYLYEILVRSTLGRMPENFGIEFVSLWQQSDKEKVDTDLVRAQADRQYFDMGVLNEGAIARELKARGTYRTMEDEDVKLAEELALQPEPEPPVNGVPVVPAKPAPEDAPAPVDA